MSTLNAAFFVKNVPSWERVIRIVVAAVAIGLSLSAFPAPLSWLLAGSAAGFAITGLVGFCPACALVGRRLPKSH